VVVTGASSGFGELTALRFAREGASVVLAARRMERLEDLARRIRVQGGTAVPVACDVAEVADLRTLRDRVGEGFGRCDVLVNDAGIAGGGSFTDLTIEQIERVNRVNFLGTVLATKMFLPMMLEQRRGHVVNVASLAGRFATPDSSMYTASKHAVVAFSESLYYELKPQGILVTVVNPFFSPTEGFPQTGVPKALLVPPERIARVIVDVVKRGRAPEVAVPRSVSALQAFRVLTPPLYRWCVRVVSKRFAGTHAGTTEPPRDRDLHGKQP
jgi:hypothetical protein